MIQDIYPKKLRNEFLPEAKASPEDFVFVFYGSKILCKIFDNGEIGFPVASMMAKDIQLIYLFDLDDEKYFLAREMNEKIDGFEFVEVRDLRKNSSGALDKIFAVFTGKHLNDWYRDTKFCGRCGNKMIHSQKERAMTCTNCFSTFYPRIMPAVIVAVTDGEKILLTKYKNGYEHFALVAGFTEIGETAEETVSREVMEETGLEVCNIRYYKSQPWGIANDLLLGFFCQIKGSKEIRMDCNELKFAQWLSREEIILQPDNISLTNEMMKIWKEGKYSF